MVSRPFINSQVGDNWPLLDFGSHLILLRAEATFHFELRGILRKRSWVGYFTSPNPAALFHTVEPQLADVVAHLEI